MMHVHHPIGHRPSQLITFGLHASFLCNSKRAESICLRVFSAYGNQHFHFESSTCRGCPLQNRSEFALTLLHHLGCLLVASALRFRGFRLTPSRRQRRVFILSFSFVRRFTTGNPRRISPSLPRMSSLDAMNFPYGPPFPSRRGKAYPNLNGFVFQPTASEYESRRMEIMYSSAKDQYLRCDDYCDDKVIKGYDKLCYAEYNTQRFAAADWDLAYIGRKQFSENSVARIDWRFDLTRVGLQVRSLQVRFPTQSFNDGYTNVSFYGQRGDGEVDHVDITEASEFLEIPEAVGWREFVLSVELLNEGENGNPNASQLFRQQLASEDTDRDSTYPFRLQIDFDDYESLQLQL